MACERHEELMDQLDDHEDRIKYLELADTETKTEMKNLIITVKELIQELKEEKKERQEEKKERIKELEEDKKWRTRFMVGGMGTLIVILLGFVAWYIQNN